MSFILDLGHSKLIRYTLDFLLELLGSRGDLVASQVASIRKQAKEVQGKLLRERIDGMDRRRASRISVSPSEVIAHLEMTTPGGKKITQDHIAAAVAHYVGLPFEKPDPLKLNAEYITGVIQRALC